MASANRTNLESCGDVRKKESHSVTAADAASEKPVRRRNSAATRARIMAVATREFANKGYEGAGTDEIADRASINKRMIYHYFSSKELLYLAVLENAYLKARAAEEKLELDHMEPLKALRTFVEFTFDSFVQDRTFINLLATENLQKAKVLKKSTSVSSFNSPIIQAMGRILARGEAQGRHPAGPRSAASVDHADRDLLFLLLEHLHALGDPRDGVRQAGCRRDAPRPCGRFRDERRAAAQGLNGWSATDAEFARSLPHDSASSPSKAGSQLSPSAAVQPPTLGVLDSLAGGAMTSEPRFKPPICAARCRSPAPRPSAASTSRARRRSRPRRSRQNLRPRPPRGSCGSR